MINHVNFNSHFGENSNPRVELFIENFAIEQNWLEIFFCMTQIVNISACLIEIQDLKTQFWNFQ